jgi:hypothetical protein
MRPPPLASTGAAPIPRATRSEIGGTGSPAPTAVLLGSRGFGGEASGAAAGAAGCGAGWGAGRGDAAVRAGAAAGAAAAVRGAAAVAVVEAAVVEAVVEAAVVEAVLAEDALAEAVEVAVAEAVVVAGRVAGAVVAADAFAADCAGADAGFKRSPTIGWREAEFDAAFAAGRDAAFPVELEAMPDVELGEGVAGLAAARGVADPAAGVRRSPMLGTAARGLAGGVGECADGLSVAGTDAGRDVGAGRSLPSGGGLDPVTTGCPLLQAASSTTETSPPNEGRCSQILSGLPSVGRVANHPSGSQASEEQIWRNGAPLPMPRRDGTRAKHWCRRIRMNSTARY